MTKLITLLFSIILLLNSCSSPDQKAIANVNELQEKVAVLKKKYNGIDVLAIKVAQKEYNESMGLIKKYYFKDTIDTDFMNALDIYRAIKTGSKAIGASKKPLEENLTLVENQLKDLKDDLTNVSIQGEEAAEALQTETQNVNRLDSALTIYLQHIDYMMFAHDSVAAYIKNKTRTF